MKQKIGFKIILKIKRNFKFRFRFNPEKAELRPRYNKDFPLCWKTAGPERMRVLLHHMLYEKTDLLQSAVHYTLIKDERHNQEPDTSH